MKMKIGDMELEGDVSELVMFARQFNDMRRTKEVRNRHVEQRREAAKRPRGKRHRYKDDLGINLTDALRELLIKNPDISTHDAVVEMKARGANISKKTLTRSVSSRLNYLKKNEYAPQHKPIRIFYPYKEVIGMSLRQAVQREVDADPTATVKDIADTLIQKGVKLNRQTLYTSISAAMSYVRQQKKDQFKLWD